MDVIHLVVLNANMTLSPWHAQGNPGAGGALEPPTLLRLLPRLSWEEGEESCCVTEHGEALSHHMLLNERSHCPDGDLFNLI